MLTEAERHIIPEDITLFREIERVVPLLPEINLGLDNHGEEIRLSCHVLARAVAGAWDNLRLVDGVYLRGFDHSWVETCGQNIIDVYPVATIGGPLLIDTSAPTLRHQLYTPFSYRQKLARYGRRFNNDAFHRAVALVEAELKRLK